MHFNCSHIRLIMPIRFRTFLRYFLMLLCVTSGPTTEAAKILGLFAHPSESNFAVMRSVMTELAKREHNVTIVSSHRLNERIDNLEEIIVEPEFQFWQEMQRITGVKNGLQELSQLPASTLQHALATVGAAATEYFLSNDQVQSILRMSPTSFGYDLIIVDLFYTDALLAFGAHFQRPTIALVSSNFEHYMTRVLESVVPSACSPIDFINYTKDIGYWQRLKQIRDCMSRRKQFVRGNWAAQQRIVQKYFVQSKAAAPLPSIAQLHSQLSVLLLNNHVPLAVPRPQLTNTIAAGGLHIRPARELPWHIKRFLDEARTGVIYMNLGNELQCKQLPKQTLHVLFAVLGKRKERVLWTCHDTQKLEELPANMMLQHMVPQTDILAHPHVKLFVMNGDLLSLQEGIVRHVPVLGIPIFSEEHENMDVAVRMGFGLKLAYANLTEVSLKWAVQATLSDTTLPVTIRQVSAVFRDRPLGALETCMYWVNYVLRHQDTSHIHTRGIGIASSQLHLFDLFLYYFAMALVIGLLLIGAYFLFVRFWRARQVEKMYSKLN